MLGRTSGGFCTCLAAFIDANGGMQLANAGQLPPYLDGEELSTPGALPLGIEPGQQYETCNFLLAPSTRVVFYSDGAAEAQNQKGELLGFERSQSLSALSAEEIARAAAEFGQEDDITVVIIERAAALGKVA
jgi:sigma-B regulation protein RsbU (phosphoserine phosphatase)